MEDFNTLLNRYVSGMATDAEEQKLFTLLHSGEYDAAFTEQFVHALETKANAVADSTHQSIAAARFNRIVEELNIPLPEAGENNPLTPFPIPITIGTIGIKGGPAPRQRTAIFSGGKGRLFRYISAAAITLLAAIGIWLFSQHPNTPPDSYRDREPQQVNTIVQATTYTGKQYINLPDGSTVLLNENSELTCAVGFGVETRTVTLTGEAFFDVAQNAIIPFIVTTDELKTTVLGTSFNIKAYKDEEIEVTVETGKVKVEATTPTPIPQHQILHAKEQAVYKVQTEQLIKTVDNVAPALSWKSNYLIFDNTTLAEAMSTLAKKHNLIITYTDEAFKNRRFTATFMHDESPRQVLEVVTGALNMTYDIEGDEVLISETQKRKEK